MSANVDYAVGFNIQNPAEEQDANRIYVRALGLTNWEIMTNTTIACDTCGQPDDQRTLRIRSTTFGSTDVLASLTFARQSNPFARIENTISLSFAANGRLSGGTEVTITGFN